MIERRRRISVNSRMEGFFVYNLSSQLLEQYPFEVSDIQKGRGAYICTTNEGKIILKEFAGSAQRAESVAIVLNKAREAEIACDQIICTKEGGVLAKDIDEISYYARYNIDARECDVRNRDDIFLAVQEMARLHVALHKTDIACVSVPQKAFYQEVVRHNREIKKLRNYIHGKHQKNEFEMIFMNHYTVFLEEAVRVEERLNQWLEEAGAAQIENMYGICHGDFNQHNVLFRGREIILTNFEQVCYDAQIIDLAHFLRKLMEKHNWNVGLAADLIGAYEKERRLSRMEWEQLYMRMAYPEKFWKVANHYYNSNKAWVSGRDIEKLNKVIEQEEIRQQFLRMLFYFVQ